MAGAEVRTTLIQVSCAVKMYTLSITDYHCPHKWSFLEMYFFSGNSL